MNDVTATIGSPRATSTSCSGSWNVRNLRLRERLAGSNEWEEFDGDERRPPAARRAWATRTSSAPTTTAASSACRSASSTPSTRLWSIYWADSRRCGVLDPPVFGTFAGDVGVFEGERHASRAGRSVVRFTWSRRRPRRRRAGSRRSRPTAARAGRRTGSWSSRRPGTRDERRSTRRRRQRRLPARRQVDRARGAPISAGAAAEVVRHRDPDAPVPARRSATLARECLATRSIGGAIELEGARLRHPAPLRRGLLLPARLHVAQRTSSGRRSGPRTAMPTRRSGPGRSRAGTIRRSASGSSARCGTSSRLDPLPALASASGRHGPLYRRHLHRAGLTRLVVLQRKLLRSRSRACGTSAPCR